VFGSFARGDASPGSDLDLLVEVAPERSFLDLVAFWQEVEEIVGRRTDVLTDGGVSPYLKDRIYAEAIPL
jgi:predicted nucleotidyltransferase